MATSRFRRARDAVVGGVGSTSAVGDESNSAARVRKLPSIATTPACRLMGEAPGATLKPPVEQAVLDGLGQVRFGDEGGAFEVGDRAGDATDFVIRAGAQAQFVHRLLHEEEAGVGE